MSKIIAFPLIIVTVIAIFFRIVLLDRIPIGISNDEIEFVINAKAIFLTGEALKVPRAELTHLIVAPIIGLLNFSLFAARLPYAIMSVLLVVFLYLITLKLIGKKEAFFVGLVASLNPWSIFFGRTSYEAPVAIFFYVLAFYLILVTRGWKILLAAPPPSYWFLLLHGNKTDISSLRITNHTLCLANNK